MAEIIIVKPIIPKKMNIKQIERVVREALAFEGRATRRSYSSTTATWDGEKPVFESDIYRKGNDAIVFTGPRPNGKGYKKFVWLDYGTRVRHALMSSDWKSKTIPGRLKSGRGRGRVIFVSRKIRRPGIKPRGWTPKIAKRRAKEFPARLDRRFARAVNNIY